MEGLLLCRTCLKTGPNTLNIFEHHKHDKLISEVIAELVNLEIQKDDGFPTNICNNCLETLNVVCDFKAMTLESHIKLNDIYNNHNLIGKIKIEAPDVESTATEVSSVKNGQMDDGGEQFKKEPKVNDVTKNLDENHSDTDKIDNEDHKDDIESITDGDSVKETTNKDKELDELHVLDESFDVSVYEDLKKSLSRAEKAKATIDCKICKKKVGFNYYFSKHLRVHMGQLPFECSLCKKRFAVPNELKKHIKNKHNENRPFKCDICQKSFKVLYTLQTHQASHRDEMCKCETCGKSFRCQLYLRNHIRKSHQIDENKKYFCEICGKSVVNATLHKQIHNPDDTFVCTQCNKQFRTKQSLYVHLKTHSEVRSYVCCDCGKTFKDSCALKSHSRRHTGDKPFACKFCEKTFNDSGTLFKHNLIHTGQRPYSCEECGKTFRYSQQLKNHNKNHHGPL